MLTLGVLLPRSTLYPSFGIDILNGIKAKLKSRFLNEDVKILVDNIGFGISEQEIYTKAEKFVLADEADIVVAVVDYRIAEILRPFFAATNKVLIIVNCGADLIENSNGQDTTIIHSLNFSFCARLTGKVAANEPQKEAINAISYYDGGYYQCYSMLNSHNENQGIPSFYHITKLTLSEFTLAPINDYLETVDNVKNVLCLFCGAEAEKFYQEIGPIQNKHQLKLFVSPMLLHNELLQSISEVSKLNDIVGYVPWSPLVDNTSNQNFISFLGNDKKIANYFTLLGWDCGELLCFIDNQIKNGIADAQKIVELMKESNLESPRGWLRIDADSNYVYGPAYKTHVAENLNITIELKEDVEAELAKFKSSSIKVSESSSWRNTYLCI